MSFFFSFFKANLKACNFIKKGVVFRLLFQIFNILNLNRVRGIRPGFNFLAVFLFLMGIYTMGSVLGSINKAAFAEEASQERVGPTEGGEENRDAKDVEKFEITGSRVRQIDVEKIYPVHSFDKEFLEQTGATTLGDALRESPLFLGGVGREKALASFGGGQSIGANILVNGLPSVYGEAAALPLAFIERAEYLDIGTVSLYGISNVLNIITKKNRTDKNVAIQYDHPIEKDGRRLRAEVGGGFQINPQWNISGALSYRWSQNLDFRDRVYARDLSYSSAGRGFPGTIEIRDDEGKVKSFAHEDCPPDGVRETLNGTICDINVSSFGTDWLPSIRQMGGILNSTIALSDKVDVFLEASFSSRITQSENAPMPFPSTWFAFVGGPVRDQDDVILPDGNGSWSGRKIRQFFHRMKGYNRIARYERTMYNMSSIFDIDFNDRWNGRVSLVWNQSFNNWSDEQGLVIASPLLYTAFKDGEYRPFGPENERGKPPVNTGKKTAIDLRSSSNYIVNLNSSISLFDWPWQEGGPLLISLFTEAIYNHGKRELPEEGKKLISGVSGSEFDIQQEYYFHSIQLLSEFSPYFTLSGSAGLKHDSASDDLQFVPSVGFSSQVLPEVLIRGNLERVVSRVSQRDKQSRFLDGGYPDYVDYTLCKLENVVDQKTKNTYCDGRQIVTHEYGNPELKPSKTLNAHLGGYFQLMENFTISINGWYSKAKSLSLSGVALLTKIEELKGRESLEKLIEEVGSIELIEDHARARLKKGDTLVMQLKRDDVGTVESPVRYIRNNLRDATSYGFDVTASFKLPILVLGGDVEMGEVVNVLLSSKSFVPLIDWEIENAGTYGIPKWRARSYIHWKRASHQLGLGIHMVSPTKKFLDPFEKARHPLYTLVDLNYKNQISFKSDKTKAFKGEFTLGIKNVFDEDVPFDVGAKPHVTTMFRENLYEPRGRVFYMAYRQYF